MLKNIGGIAISHSNLSLSSKNKSKVNTFPVFYKESVSLWSNKSNMEIITQEDVLSQSIWDNKFVTIQGKAIVEPILANKGIRLISQLYINGRGKHGKQSVLSSIYPLAPF